MDDGDDGKQNGPTIHPYPSSLSFPFIYATKPSAGSLLSYLQSPQVEIFESGAFQDNTNKNTYKLSQQQKTKPSKWLSKLCENSSNGSSSAVTEAPKWSRKHQSPRRPLMARDAQRRCGGHFIRLTPSGIVIETQEKVTPPSWLTLRWLVSFYDTHLWEFTHKENTLQEIKFKATSCTI